MPHAKSAEHKSRVCRQKAGRNVAEYLYTNVHSLCIMLASHGIDLNTILVYLHGNVKRTMYKKSMYTDERKDDSELNDPRVLDFVIFVGEDNKQHTYTMSFESLGKKLSMSIDDVEFYKGWYHERDMKTTEGIQKIVYDWILEMVPRYISSTRWKYIKKELVAAAWHPRRVSAWLEAGVQLEDM